MTEHEDFEGLAVGDALHALEPQDEQRLSAHLLTCQNCARLVAETAALGASFAAFLEPDSPPPGLRERILAAAAAEPRVIPPAEAAPTVSPAPAAPRRFVQPLRGRRIRLQGRVAVGVLAAVLGVGVAVPVTLAVSDSGRPGSTNAMLAEWLLKPQAREITLRGASQAPLAKAVMTASGIYLLADRLPVNDRARSIYVLWAANMLGERISVATFDVRQGPPVQLTVTKLPYKMSEISQVAISYEPGRKAPSSPSDVVLSGSTA